MEKTVCYSEVFHFMDSYERVVNGIKSVLEKRYQMSPSEASEAIASSPLKSIFDEYGEMALHTSKEAWARKIFDYWKR